MRIPTKGDMKFGLARCSFKGFSPIPDDEIVWLNIVTNQVIV